MTYNRTMMAREMALAAEVIRTQAAALGIDPAVLRDRTQTGVSLGMARSVILTRLLIETALPFRCGGAPRRPQPAQLPADVPIRQAARPLPLNG